MPWYSMPRLPSPSRQRSPFPVGGASKSAFRVHRSLSPPRGRDARDAGHAREALREILRLPGEVGLSQPHAASDVAHLVPERSEVLLPGVVDDHGGGAVEGGRADVHVRGRGPTVSAAREHRFDGPLRMHADHLTAIRRVIGHVLERLAL